MAKITERALKDVCAEVNAEVFKTWSFGLKVERVGEAGFQVYQLFRKPGKGQKPLLNHPLAAKEAYCFIEGFRQAAVLANAGEGRGE
jgi:hypothetical protein